MKMLIADSGVSSSISSRSPLIPNSVESSSPIASIEDKVRQSLALSSPNRDRDNQNSSNSDGFSTSSSEETISMCSRNDLEDDECDNDAQAKPKSQLLPLNNSKCNNNAISDIDELLWEACSSELGGHRHRWTPNLSPGYGSDEGDDDDDNSKMECSQPLSLGFKQVEPLKIEEPIVGVGAGLWNLGSTCFLNSVLQCLTHTVPLIESLRSYKCQDPCNCGNEFFCVIRALRFHIELALRPQRYTLAPHYFFNHLNYFSPDFQRYQQEDAHEFLQAFLDKLERCCLDSRTYRGYMSSQDVNIVEHVFGGRLVSGLRCCNCNSVSETFEKSVGFSLEIEHVDTLWSALESFTSVEKLDEQLTCDNCKEKVSKEKQLLLDKLPLVATFHLKRFKNNGYVMEKIFKHVKIPLELDLQPYMRDNQENGVSTKYYLYALVEHFGCSLGYGHYSSYVRSAPKIWHQFDDMQVTRIDEDSVLSQDSYILFYVKEGTPWFSRAFEEMQPLLEASLRISSPQSVLDSTNGECVSEISYEAVDKSNKPCNSAEVSNQNVSTEEDFVSLSREDVFLSAESSEEDSTMEVLLNPLETADSYNSCTEKESDSCLAIERASTCDEFFPLLMVDPSPKQQVGAFQTLLNQLEETPKNVEEPCKQPLIISDDADSKEAEFAHRDDLMKKPSPRARELQDQAISTTGSPPKKIKTA